MSPEVTIALIGIAGTLIGTLGGNAVSNYFAARREDRQWDRQMEEQRRAEFLEAYERLVETVTTLVETGEARQVDSLQALARVEFLAPAHVRNQAKALHKAALNLWQEFYGSNINDVKKRDEAGSAFLEERDRFITAVRREVGPLNEGKQLGVRGER